MIFLHSAYGKNILSFRQCKTPGPWAAPLSKTLSRNVFPSVISASRSDCRERLETDVMALADSQAPSTSGTAAVQMKRRRSDLRRGREPGGPWRLRQVHCLRSDRCRRKLGAWLASGPGTPRFRRMPRRAHRVATEAGFGVWRGPSGLLEHVRGFGYFPGCRSAAPPAQGRARPGIDRLGKPLKNPVRPAACGWTAAWPKTR